MKQLFDAARPISIKALAGGAVKQIEVRWPSDEEWIARQRSRKIVVKQLGRGSSETSLAGGDEAAAELLAAIRTDGGEPRLTPAEASRVIDQLSLAEVTDAEYEGGRFRVELRIPGGTAGFLLAMPSAEDEQTYRRSFARAIDRPYGKSEVTIHLDVAGALFQKLELESSGYVGAVPVIHQAAVVKAAIDLLAETLSADADPN